MDIVELPVDDDVLDEPIGTETTWTRVNVGEAYPGVPTPLTWSWAGPAADIGLTEAWARMGVYSRVPARRHPDPARRSIAITSGRVVLNLDVFKGLGDRLPFNSGDKVEQNFFSSEAFEPSSRPIRRRYPIVAVKLPVALIRARRELVGSAPGTESWWRESLRRVDGDPEAATALLYESCQRYCELATVQGLTSLAGQGLFEVLTAVCARYGDVEDAGLLATSPAHTAATRTVEDLWQLSRNGLDLAEFLDRHGYQSPVQGELAVPSWRVDPSPVVALAKSYAARGEDDDAEAAQQRRRAKRSAAQTALLSAAPSALRPPISRLIRAVSAVVPLREVARNQFLQAYDVARAAAAQIGTEMAREGLLGAPDDAVYLTMEELIRRHGPDAALLAQRRERRSFYQAHEIPMRFTGRPVLVARVAHVGVPILTGIGASGGVAEGRARIISEGDCDELEHGEILVAETTNPSYAAQFLVAAGVVVDIGGPLSHGAVVAREMGIPCVINTRTACGSIRTGDLIRIDGTTGRVEVLEPAARV